MTPDAAVVVVQDALDRAAIPWMIVGSLASNFHGVPRATRDADFVVAIGPGSIDRLAQALPPTLLVSAQGAFEAVTGTTRFARRLRVGMLNREVFVATAEDTVVTKLRWAKDAWRSKDRDDIRNIIALRQSTLDWTYIERWSAAHGTTALLREIQTGVR